MKKTNMSDMRIKFVGLLWVCLTGFSAFAQNNLQSLNQSLRYSRYARVAPKVIPIKTGERTFKLQMSVEKIEEDATFEDYLFSYAIVGSFQEEILDESIIALDGESLVREVDSHFYFEEEVQVPEGQEEAYVIFWAKDSRQGDEYIYHVDLISPFVEDIPSFGAYYGNDIPYDQTYLNVEESLLFNGYGVTNLHHFYYPQEFPLPLPPMETKPGPVAREVPVEYQGDFLINVPQSFDRRGYYFIQSDTTANSGVLVKTTGKSFPRVSSWEEMVQMVTYISTRQEHEKLQEAENKKLALDEYWIQMTKDEDKAKELIKEYFRQVEFANILFTDFKDGWATDRGMVYIIMGPPQEVYFNLNRESWIYLGNDPNSKITFTFARVKNILTPNYYTLNRSRSYQPEWFRTITAWRNGQMAF